MKKKKKKNKSILSHWYSLDIFRKEIFNWQKKTEEVKTLSFIINNFASIIQIIGLKSKEVLIVIFVFIFVLDFEICYGSHSEEVISIFTWKSWSHSSNSKIFKQPKVLKLFFFFRFKPERIVMQYCNNTDLNNNAVKIKHLNDVPNW